MSVMVGEPYNVAMACRDNDLFQIRLGISMMVIIKY